MGTTYHYANLTKREWFAADALGGSAKLNGLGLNLTARAFDLLLVQPTAPQSTHSSIVECGRWCNDSIAIIGDTAEEWLAYESEFADLSADVILLVCQHGGFDAIAEAASCDQFLFRQLCHLVVTGQATELEADVKRHFGANFRQRYKDSCNDQLSRPTIPSKDLLRTLGK